MIGRAISSLAVLTATIYWAGCDPTPVGFLPANNFFAGCFQGPVDSSVFEEVILVLEEPEKPGSMLKGCLQWRQGTRTETGIIAGALQSRTNAELVVASRQRPTAYTMLVERDPPGNAPAITVDLSHGSGAPFTSAADVPRCPQPRTCADLGIHIIIPFLPGRGAP